MDRNTTTGFVLLALLVLVYSYISRPSEAEIQRIQAKQDSIRVAQQLQDSLAELGDQRETIQIDTSSSVPQNDSVNQAKFSQAFGVFASAASGTESDVVLENKQLKITFNTKGGVMKEVLLKEHFKLEYDAEGNSTQIPLYLLEDERNRFEFIIPMSNTARGDISTNDLYFQAQSTENSVTFKAVSASGQSIEQTYTLKPDSYHLDYDVKLNGLGDIAPRDAKNVTINWINYIDKLEHNSRYERMYAGFNYLVKEDGVESTSFTGDVNTTVEETMEWVSNTQQFFNSTLFYKDGFKNATFDIKDYEEDRPDLKRFESQLALPFDQSSQSYDMAFYLGPNEFDRLRAYDSKLEEVIQFGWGIFGSINRWIIRPVFKFLQSNIGIAGISILVLTLIVKVFVYPLTFRMLRSQAKMKVLKPQLEKIKEKTGDDQQAYSAEQMKLYRETGVNPLGGCWPMLLQMPIWFALYRFFPASIEFRQESFLWADDLSSYDSILTFGEIPLISSIYGDHVSLFTLLWVITTIIYTFYNTRHMSMPNPSMKYIQYAMPVMFIFFFNNYAAGLTCYLLFSNVMNITQNLATQKYIINHKKIEDELEANKKKPKKKSGFQARLEEAMKQQQEVQKKQDTARKNRKKK